MYIAKKQNRRIMTHQFIIQYSMCNLCEVGFSFPCHWNLSLWVIYQCRLCLKTQRDVNSKYPFFLKVKSSKSETEIRKCNQDLENNLLQKKENILKGM